MALSSRRPQRWGFLFVRAGRQAMANWIVFLRKSMPSQLITLFSGFHSRWSNVIEKVLLYLPENKMGNLCICSTVP